MSNAGKSPSAKRIRFTPQSSDPVNPAEGDLFHSDGTPRTEGLWSYINGAWEFIGPIADSPAVTYNPTILAQTTDPTEGSADIRIYSYRLDENVMTIWGAYFQATAGSDGSGVYIIPLPSGFEFDATLIRRAPSTTEVSTATALGVCKTSNDTAQGYVVAFLQTVKEGLVLVRPNGTTVGSTSTSDFGTTNFAFNFSATFPVVES